MISPTGHLLGTLPADCVSDCSHAGQCDEDVEYWRKTLDFTVPRELAINWLAETGGWPRNELQQETDETLAERVLWLVCCSLKETGEWDGLL